eukprot:COSAG06_NODE_13720_length_1225_cov_18.503552_2_plen_58_part_00
MKGMNEFMKKNKEHVKGVDGYRGLSMKADEKLQFIEKTIGECGDAFVRAGSRQRRRR